MAHSTFETAHWISFPVELVFAFFANPHNLPHLMPPGLRVQIDRLELVVPPPRPEAVVPERQFQSLAAGAGTRIGICFRPLPWLPLRTGWTARIVEFAWNSHFIDHQESGPFAYFRHRHGIEPRWQEGQEGTWVSDRIEYALPGGRFGQAAGPLLRRQLDRQFTLRQAKLPEILSTAARQASRRS